MERGDVKKERVGVHLKGGNFIKLMMYFRRSNLTPCFLLLILERILEGTSCEVKVSSAFGKDEV